MLGAFLRLALPARCAAFSTHKRAGWDWQQGEAAPRSRAAAARSHAAISSASSRSNLSSSAMICESLCVHVLQPSVLMLLAAKPLRPLKPPMAAGRRQRRCARFPAAAALTPRPGALTCTALSVYSRCASLRGLPPKPPPGLRQDSTQSATAAVSISPSRPSSAIAVRPQYMPLIQKCSVATASSRSEAWWRRCAGVIGFRVGAPFAGGTRGGAAGSRQRARACASGVRRAAADRSGGPQAPHLPDPHEALDVLGMLLHQQGCPGAQVGRRRRRQAVLLHRSRRGAAVRVGAGRARSRWPDAARRWG